MAQPGSADSTADFRVPLESAPGLHLVLAPDLNSVVVSGAYVRATMTRREDILGRAGVRRVYASASG